MTHSHGTVMIGTFACLENCDFGLTWFLTKRLPSNLQSCEFDVVVEELQRGILILRCLKPNWPE